MKGTWYTTGTRYFIVGCKISPDGTSWGFDRHARRKELPGYGWAQVTPDVDERYALAANVWTGIAARIDLREQKIVQQMDTDFTAPVRSLAGIAVFSARSFVGAALAATSGWGLRLSYSPAYSTSTRRVGWPPVASLRSSLPPGTSTSTMTPSGGMLIQARLPEETMSGSSALSTCS